jgi:2-succinyl-6-hydroxy-2,4-cyclohexadiene-1-carboxylate synthase
VTSPDLPGHGDGPAEAMDLAATAEHILAVTGTLDGAARTRAAAAGSPQVRPVVFVGYSFGGRVCLRLAVDHPEAVDRLVLVGATAGLDDPAERSARRVADEALAAEIEAGGVEPFLDRWLALPLFAGLAPASQHREERRRNRPAGLASSLRLAGTGAQEPLWDRLPALAGMPVLLVTGERDVKFTALAERLAAGIGPSASHLVIPAAGHTAHLEQPDAFLAGLLAWLAPD